MPKKRDYTIAEYAKLWAGSAPSTDTMTRRRHGIQKLVDDFGSRPLNGGLTDPEARSWAPRNPGNIRYAKGMFTAAVEDGVADKDPFRRCRQPAYKRSVVVPTVEQLRAAADAALEMPRYGREFRALILVAAGSGLRVSELCALEVRDVVEVPDLELKVRDGKGGFDRTAMVVEPFGGSLVAEALREQLRATGAGSRVGRVWLRPPGAYRRGSPYLNRSDVDKLWRGYGQQQGVRSRVGLDGCRWHDLRHFYATWLLDQGGTAEEVAWQLHGHPNPQLVIRVYGHPSAARARERLRAKVAGRA